MALRLDGQTQAKNQVGLWRFGLCDLSHLRCVTGQFYRHNRRILAYRGPHRSTLSARNRGALPRAQPQFRPADTLLNTLDMREVHPP